MPESFDADLRVREMTCVLAPDGTTVLIAPIADGDDIVMGLFCGGDRAHRPEHGVCDHIREFLAVQEDVPGRRFEVRLLDGRTLSRREALDAA